MNLDSYSLSRLITLRCELTARSMSEWKSAFTAFFDDSHNHARGSDLLMAQECPLLGRQ